MVESSLLLDGFKIVKKIPHFTRFRGLYFCGQKVLPDMDLKKETIFLVRDFACNIQPLWLVVRTEALKMPISWFFCIISASSPLHLSRPEHPKNGQVGQQQIRSSMDMVRVYNYGPQSLQAAPAATGAAPQNANLMVVVICNSNFLLFHCILMSIFGDLLAASESRHDVSFSWSQQSLQPSSHFRLLRLFWIACLQQLQYV